jgi:dTDP-4-dehydrorhamnose reductase
LVTGGGGQLASDLADQLPGRFELTVLSEAELDITNYEAVARTFAEVRPDVVFNCAAFLNVDACEREEDMAFEVNARAVKRLAQYSAETGAQLVHISTNYVFDGSAQRPYIEADIPSPRSTYAISKLAGEYAALAYDPAALVVRTAGLYGLHGSEAKGGNFVDRVLQRARDQGAITMVADQRLTPTYTVDLAGALIDAVEAGAQGLLHLTNAGECSWYEFTVELLELAGMAVPVEAVATAPRPGVASRPLNGLLASVRAVELGLEPLQAWPEALREYMALAGLAAVA